MRALRASFVSKLVKSVPRGAVGVAFLLLAACQTTAPFPQPDATWETRVGQLQYVAGDRAVVGECVLSRHGSDNFQLDFHSGPGFPLLRLWVAQNRARAEGVLARGSWQGRADSAPSHLQGWLEMARRVPRDAHGRLAYHSKRTGERFQFALSR